MRCQEKQIKLKDGRYATFRSPLPEDSAEMIEFLKTCAGETDFILRYPEECTETEAQGAAYLENINNSESGVMIVCVVAGKIAGNCQIAFHRRIKTRHRASVAIGLRKQYWGLGIGTAMFEEMIELAGNYGVSQLELEFIEGNERAKALYEKMGFEIIAEKADAIRLKDGTSLKEYTMVKKLK